jgi:two-component system NtrC family response regulator
MPGMNGIQVLKEIKRIKPKAEVIMVTAYGTIETAVEVMKIGAIDYITKPIDIEELLTIINNAVERKAAKRGKVHS